MNWVKIIEIVSETRTPLALGGVIAAFFTCTIHVLIKKEIIKPLTKKESAKTVNLIIISFFALSAIAVVSGLIGFVAERIMEKESITVNPPEQAEPADSAKQVDDQKRITVKKEAPESSIVIPGKISVISLWDEIPGKIIHDTENRFVHQRLKAGVNLTVILHRTRADNIQFSLFDSISSKEVYRSENFINPVYPVYLDSVLNKIDSALDEYK